MRKLSELELIEKFDKLSNSLKDENGCIVWSGVLYKNGYGRFNLRLDSGETIFGAHRVSWFLKHKYFDRDKYVCHKCDNKYCVNTEHMFLGTAKDNSVDMVNKGRQKGSLGYRHTAKNIEIMKGRKFSESHRNNISKANIIDVCEKDIDYIINLFNKGFTNTIVSELSGYSVSISKRIKRENYHLISKKRFNNKPNKIFKFDAQQKEEIFNLKFNKGLTNKEISNKLNVPYGPTKTLNSKMKRENFL